VIFNLGTTSVDNFHTSGAGTNGKTITQFSATWKYHYY
jgi:hypothetical protein